MRFYVTRELQKEGNEKYCLSLFNWMMLNGTTVITQIYFTTLPDKFKTLGMPPVVPFSTVDDVGELCLLEEN